MQGIKWGKGREQQCLEWLDEELRAAQNARQTLEARWRDWLEQYRAPAIQPTKSFPFEGAANYVLPITATVVDQLYAKELQTIFAQDSGLWALEGLNESWEPAAKPLQDGLAWLDVNVLHMWDVCKRLKLEKFKLGTGIYKTGWLYESRPVWTYNDKRQQVRAQKTIGRPFVDHVRLSDFILPPYSYAIQADLQGGAPWVAERLRMNVDRFRSLARSSEPFLPGISNAAVNEVLKFLESADTPHDVKVQDLDFVKRGATTETTDAAFDTDKATTGAGSIRRARPREIELWEFHARFPTGGRGGPDNPSRDTQGDDDSQDDIVLWYHQPTRQFVRCVFNPYHHGKRPYEVERMFPGDGFYGIGVCEQLEMFQKARSELLNFTYDNVLLGNSLGIAAKAGANIAPGEPIYPGKIWITDGNVNEDFKTFQLGSTYPNLEILQQMVASEGDRRTAVGDLQLGNMQNMPGRTPATTVVSMLQEGNRRPDFAIKDSRYEGLAVVGLRIVQLMQQFIGSPVDVGGKTLLRLMVQSLGMPEGLHAAQKLSTPMESAELGLGVSIAATSGNANKEVARQNRVALLQLAAQVTPQFIQLISVAQQAQGTPVGKTALESAIGLRNLYQSTLEQYDVRNIEDVAPDIAKNTEGLDAPPTPENGGQPAGPLGGTGGLVAPTGGTPDVQNVLATLGIGG